MIKRFFYRVFCGFFLGLSVFAPGFSGSLIAIVLGIYQDLLRVFSNPFKPFKKNMKFVFPLGIGAVVSAVLFVLFFKYLFEAQEKATYFLFIGLIAGNLPIILSSIRKNGIKAHYFVGAAGAFAAALLFGLLSTSGESAIGAAGADIGLYIIAIGGLAAGITALIPGMSVTVVLLMIGVYEQLLFIAESLLHFNFTDLLPFLVFLACAVLGLVLSSKGIGLVFRKHPGFANTTVFGFMSGSLIGILVQSLKISDPGFTWLSGALMLTLGLAVSMLFVFLGRVMNKNKEA